MRAIHLYSRLLAMLALATLAAGTLWSRPSANEPRAQQAAQAPSQETVVNLAAGSVVVAVAKDAIVIGTIENAIEPDTHPPIPVQIGSSQVAVILGAVEWIAPDAKLQLGRLDQELPHLRGREARTPPSLGSPAGKEAVDVESVGDGVFDRLSELVGNLHSKIDMPSSEPAVVLIVADYLPGYGPEVWRLDYRFEQSEESLGYWSTHVLRPTYTQCWPPEKGHPRTLLEFTYPLTASETAEPRSQSLMHLWSSKDPRLEKIAVSDASLGGAGRALMEGDSNKVLAAAVVQFLRAALDAVWPRDARETMATLGEESGLKWILRPPAEAAKPGVRPERPSNAPSLAAPPSLGASRP
jgi:hypothetical protein